MKQSISTQLNPPSDTRSKKIPSNIEWEAWGEDDPMWGVSTVDERSRRGKNPWTVDEFYAQGPADWALLLPHWEQYGVVKKTCLEIGCGAGRMTRMLAGTFEQVHGCDVSPGMIATAREGLRDIRNVEFHLTDGASFPLANGSITAAFSTIVFQHFSDPMVARGNFAEIYRCLATGGSMMINVPLHDFPFTSFAPGLRLLYRVGRFYDDTRAGWKRMILKTPIARTRVGRRFAFHMHAISYDYPWIFAQLVGLGFRDIQVRSFWVESEKRPHYYVFGRKL